MKRVAIALCLVLLLQVTFLHGQTQGADAETISPLTFSVAPYLLDVQTTTATVAFHLPNPSKAEVRIFDRNGLKEIFPSDQISKSHFIKITHLEANQTYRYEVVCGENESPRTPPGDASYQIRTACREGESFTFAVYGDPRPGDTQTQRHHRDVIGQVMKSDPLFCLILGDLADDGTRENLWEDFFRVESPLARRSALYAVMGDNDFANGKGLYARYFPKLQPGWYDFEWGGVRFFGLRAWDARGAQPRSELDAASPQYLWLQERLADEDVQKAPYRIVFLHDPVAISRGRSAEILQRVWAPLFRKYRVDAVFASWHMYERLHSGGLPYIITGGAGAELIWMDQNPTLPSQVEARRYHYCRVDVSAGGLNIRAIADDGTVLDDLLLAPRSSGEEAAKRLERTARRLRREILIGDPSAGEPMPLHLFSYDCASCKKLLYKLLPRWADEHNVAFRISYYDLSTRGAYDLLMAAGADFGRQSADIPTLFAGRAVLGGEKEIVKEFPAQIEAFRENPSQYFEDRIVPFRQIHDTKTMREEAFESLTLAVVLGAGLLDGVNPCAFTTLIFLISYLSLVGSSRRQMLATGGLFTLAVFLTYLAIGLFLYEIASWVFHKPALSAAINYALFVGLLFLAGLSFADFARCLTGRPGESFLQLPGFLKKQTHERVRRFARNKLGIGAAAFFLGVVIAGLELACTGQVYLPIVTMIADPRHRAAASFYLILYNIAFILPLLAVFLTASLGVTSEAMAQFFKRHLPVVKLAFAALFLLMAGVIAYNLGWVG